MRMYRSLCAGLLLLGTAGCSDQPNDIPASIDSVTAIPLEAGDAVGEDSMKGLFTYMADAALFEDCSSGRRYPVAMEAGYLELERTYLELRIQPGEPLLVLIGAGVEKRPPMEGDGDVDTVIVEEFKAAYPGEDCSG